jgi:CopG-like RHH_1 or ribbon-helix-helix domain, RHH_5
MPKAKVKSARPHSSKTPRTVSRPKTRRTTLSLPEELLRKIERFAAPRHQTVSSAVAYLIEGALRNEPELARNSRGILDMWRKSYLPLTDKERLLVDGIILEEPVTEAE